MTSISELLNEIVGTIIFKFNQATKLLIMDMWANLVMPIRLKKFENSDGIINDFKMEYGYKKFFLKKSKPIKFNLIEFATGNTFVYHTNV